MSKYDVFELVSHLKKCPDAFLAPSVFIETKGLNTRALISDTYRNILNDFLKNEFKIPKDSSLKSLNDNHLRAIHISIWLLNHQDFKNNPTLEESVYKFWFEELFHASAYVKFKKWIDDDERTEEMVGLLLKCCEVIPNGETLEAAADKFSSLSSLDRHKVLKESYQAHERIMKIKREMAAKKAREAANAYGRE